MSQSSSRGLPQAASGSNPIRIVVESSATNSRQERVFDGPFVLVGRHQRADLRLDSPEISSRQLYLHMIGGRLFGVHLSNHNPTLWGTTAKVSGWVDAEKGIKVGSYRLRFPSLTKTDRADPVHAANPLTAGSWHGQPVTLELQRGRSAPLPAVINRMMTLVGNLPICKLRMNSSRVSRIHCALVRSDEGLSVVDLVSREGVRVNGSNVRSKLLWEGDCLDIGGRELVVRYAKGDETPSINESAANTEDGYSFSPTEIAVAANLGPPKLVDDEDAAESALGTIIEGFSSAQPQSAEQFRAMMAAMMQAFGMMFVEHRRFVQEEMSRLDELTRFIAERQAPPADPRTGAPTNGRKPPEEPVPDLSVPLPPLGDSPAADHVHAWLQQRIEEMGEKRASFWKRMAGMLRTKPPETPRG